MSLVIFIVSVIVVLAAGIVLNLLVARERVSFDASMAILATLISISIICFSLSLQATSLIIKLTLIVVAAFILLAVFSHYAAFGLVSLFWWLGKDTGAVEKEKTKTCSACKTENMLGKSFCIKCGKKLPHFENEKKRDELPKSIATHRKIPLRKVKTKICPRCGAENMFGRFFCMECGKQMIFPTNMIRNLKIPRKAPTDKKKSKKLP